MTNIEDADEYIGTCDAGCDRETVAIVLTEDHGWLSMCIKHAQREINQQYQMWLRQQLPESIRNHLRERQPA